MGQRHGRRDLQRHSQREQPELHPEHHWSARRVSVSHDRDQCQQLGHRRRGNANGQCGDDSVHRDGHDAASATAYTGGYVTFTAAFDGNHPIAYQWQVDKGSGYTNLLNATNAALAADESAAL